MHSSTVAVDPFGIANNDCVRAPQGANGLTTIR